MGGDDSGKDGFLDCISVRGCNVKVEWVKKGFDDDSAVSFTLPGPSYQNQMKYNKCRALFPCFSRGCV